MITLTQLEYVVAVDTYRHFATAAEKCFVTQPTLSMQLKKLEEELDVVIFDRSRQPILPTEIGRKIIEQARNTLREANKIGELIADHRGEISGTLRIGIIPTLTPYLLPRFIGSLSKQYPNLDICVEEHYTSAIEEKLKNEQLDIGILITPLNNPGIEEEPLFYEELKLFANKQHELAKKNSVVISDIVSPDLWLLSDGHCFRNQVINLCHKIVKNRTHLPFRFDGGSLETIMKIISLEGGFTLIPELATTDIPYTTNAMVQNFTDDTPLREISLVFAKHFAKPRLIEIVKDEILQHIPERMRNKNRGTIVQWR